MTCANANALHTICCTTINENWKWYPFRKIHALNTAMEEEVTMFASAASRICTPTLVPPASSPGTVAMARSGVPFGEPGVP